MADTGAPWTTIGKERREFLPLIRRRNHLLPSLLLPRPFLSKAPTQMARERTNLNAMVGEYRERNAGHEREERTRRAFSFFRIERSLTSRPRPPSSLSFPPNPFSESDPGVFTELMEAMGVPGVQMEELYSLDSETLKAMAPVHGLIFLFRWTPEAGDDDRGAAASVSESETPPGMFFARQVATNACATQAILSILLNRPGKVELGGAAATLKEFCAGLTPEVAGLALASW